MGFQASLTVSNPAEEALRTAKLLFEPQLRALGFAEDQIRSYDLEKLEAALDRMNDNYSKS